VLSVRAGIGFLVGVFAAVGAAFGVVGYTAMRWAQVQFVSAAGGADPGRFGPVLLAVVFFGTTVTFLLAGPLLAGAVGAVVGSQFPRPREAAVVGGVGSLLGFGVLIVLGLGVTALVGGEGTGQLYRIGSAVGPLFLSAVATGFAGAVAGAVGSFGAG
jgi:hypothetical protein